MLGLGRIVIGPSSVGVGKAGTIDGHYL
jgi:hypothetical protein